MTLKTRTTEKGINAMMILFVYMAALLYASLGQAQSFLAGSQSNQERNASNKIALAKGINTEAHSVVLNSSINSAYEELKPQLAPGGQRLYFSRTFHPNNTSGKNDNEDIWYSDYSAEENAWSEPIRLSGELNNDGPNYINNVSTTGDTIIVGNQYLKKGKMRGGVSYSVNKHGVWSSPIPIVVKNDYNISEHANYYVSLSNGVIISSIQRSETHGERDLYVSFWNGVYATEPINMGGVINTEMEEASPFLCADNKTLYFASRGHGGYGGYDIWVTKRLDDSWTNWSEPKNLGPAVNSSQDDEFFTLTHCEGYAIFSKRVSIHNVDLFRISMLELYGQPEVKKIDLNSTSTLGSL